MRVIKLWIIKGFFRYFGDNFMMYKIVDFFYYKLLDKYFYEYRVVLYERERMLVRGRLGRYDE